MTYVNEQWQEAIVGLANNGVSAVDISTTGTISADQGAVNVNFGAGVASWLVDARGTFNAGTTLFFEFSSDNTNWQAAYGVPVGSTSDVAVSSVAGGAAIVYQGNAAGFQYFRVRAHPFAGGDSVSIKIVGSVATDGGFVSKSLPPGSNTIGAVAIAPLTTGGTSTYHAVSAASNNAASVKASAGQLYGWDISNTNAAWRYVKLFNKASSPTPGTDTVVRTIGVPPGGKAFNVIENGQPFATGLALAIVTGIADSDNTSVGASDVVVDLDYK